jgi:hypothetical protein
MKNKLLSSAFTVIFLFIGVFSYSQNYDLIVTAKGDSIACRIDSITDTHIYFEMKSRNSWALTSIGLADVSEYKRDAIFRKEFVYKMGTSIIESRKPAIPASIWDIQKNSVYVGILSLTYARMIPAGDHVGITFGGGLYHFDATGVVGESSVIVGGVKHFFEPGIMGVYFFGSNSGPDQEEEDSVVGAAAIRMGYRYQGPGGLLLRAAPNFIFTDKDFFVFPALSIGYSF